MKKILPVFLFIIQFQAHAQDVVSLSFDELLQKKISVEKGLVVVNFWATWCKPCVEELPYFEEVNSEFQNRNVKFILVNVDFNSRVEKEVKPFVKKKNLRSEILHLTDTDANSWINRVDSSWGGAIPATSMYQNGKKVFFREGSMTKQELTEALNSKIGHNSPQK